MWTIENRARYDRSKLRYSSDLTDDAEWRLACKLADPTWQAWRRCKRTVVMREVGERPHVHSPRPAVSGARSRKDLPPKSTVFYYFDLWNYDGTLERIHQPRFMSSVANKLNEKPSLDRRHHRQPEREKRGNRGGLALIRMGTMRARRSRARSGTFLSTH